MKKIYSIMVTYYPRIETLKINLISVLNQVDKIIIVDNTISPEYIRRLKECIINEIDNNKIDIIANCRNVGVAEGQNIGIRQAIKEGALHVFLLDQDSMVKTDTVNKLYNALLYLESLGIRVAAVGPLQIDINTSKPYKYNGINLDLSNIIEVKILPASGMLIPKEAILKIGLMDKSLFIDKVDFEWDFRARSMGYHIFLIKDAIMYHKVGKKFIKNKLFDIYIPEGWRNYYIYRNSFLLYKRSYVPKKWKIINMWCLVAYVIIQLINNNEKSILYYIIRGIIDGWKNNHYCPVKVKSKILGTPKREQDQIGYGPSDMPLEI